MKGFRNILVHEYARVDDESLRGCCEEAGRLRSMQRAHPEVSEGEGLIDLCKAFWTL
ncbi:MAG: DUF86 domain-containing protein [Deltaproteobacteria bacterium]|nr:DUF86 domain-containing protein [Deltaproteobacteria bacterium]